MAQTERFELPSPRDTGFQIRRNTRLCDVCSVLGSVKHSRRMNLAGVRGPMHPGLHHAGRPPVAASGWVRLMNRIMMIMKNAGNNAVIVRIPESGSP